MVNSCTNEIDISDIVKFKKANPSNASQFCFANDLTGRVVSFDLSYCIVDFGLGYDVYALPKHLIVVAKNFEIPELSEVGD